MGAYSYCPHCGAGQEPTTASDLIYGHVCHVCHATLRANRTLEEVVAEQAGIIEDLLARVEQLERRDNP